MPKKQRRKRVVVVSPYFHKKKAALPPISDGESKEDMCVAEFKAFARGGLYSLSVLNKVWPNILREYGADSRRLTKMLNRAGLYQSSAGKICPFTPEDDE